MSVDYNIIQLNVCTFTLVEQGLLAAANKSFL